MRKELVRREADPRDKRGALVTLTGQGRARVDAALDGLLRRERVLLAGLDDSERQQLADLMRILLVPFDYPRSTPGALLSRSLCCPARRRALSSRSPPGAF